MRISDAGSSGLDLQYLLRVAIDAMNDTPHYGGDVDTILIKSETVRPRCYDFTLRIAGHWMTGAAITASGRRSINACWHAHRDVMAALFAQHSRMTLTSAVSRYLGRSGFLDTFADTGYRNVGSLAQPVRAVDACGCRLGVGEYGDGVEDAIASLWVVAF